jgi:DTW domain-containing protein YfiP
MAIQTRVSVLMHRREQHTTSNTGRLAQVGLKDSDLWIRGNLRESSIPEGGLDPKRRLLVLYPTPSAQALGPDFCKEYPGPYQLVVPDGSWRQASKIPSREPGLRSAIAVGLSKPRPSQYQLRREPKPEGLATLEALSQAMYFLESPECAQHLNQLFLEFVRRSLLGRTTFVPKQI